MPDNLFMTAFRKQRLGLMLAAIMAILVYFATIAALGETFLANAVHVWNSGQQGHVTVEIPPPDRPEISQTDRIKKVTTLLEASHAVSAAKTLSTAETAQLLDPWLKDNDLAQSLPLPALIDVQIAPGQNFDPQIWRDTLSIQVPGVIIDDPAAWLADLIAVTKSIGLIAAVLLVLTALTLAITIGLICRAAMAVQHETIELLHLLGATDNDIARQFERHTGRLSWPAALIGFTCAAFTTIAVVAVLKHFMKQLVTVNASYFSWGIMVFFVPILAFFCATLTARYSVMKRLKQIL